MLINNWTTTKLLILHNVDGRVGRYDVVLSVGCCDLSRYLRYPAPEKYSRLIVCLVLPLKYDSTHTVWSAAIVDLHR